MKYEIPNLEVIRFEDIDIVRTSFTGENGGDTTGGWD